MVLRLSKISSAMETKIIFANLKMRAIFKSVWVRKLIGKLGVPYNRRLRVRDSSHPLNLCRRFITPRSGKQRFPYPLRFDLPRAFNGIVDGLGFIGRKACAYQDTPKISLFDLWPANFIFHICLTFMLTQSYFMFNI
jgi:hypothetical protein